MIRRPTLAARNRVFCASLQTRSTLAVAPVASVPCATLAPVPYTDEQLHALIDRCEPLRDVKAPAGYRDSLALCVVDSVQSTGVTYSSVESVVGRYRAYRREQAGDPNTDGVPELLTTFDELSGPDGWAQRIGNRNRTSTHAGAPLKGAAIRDAALALTAEGINTAASLREAAEDAGRLACVEAAWRAVPGQRSGITWHYVQMLAGIPGVKPDRMICRFVADALGMPRRAVTTGFALRTLTAAAAEMGMSPTDLDHGVWQWQRRQR